MRAERWIAVAMATGGLALAACGGSGSETTSPPAQLGFSIRISGMAFSPLNLRVPAGSTVTVLNEDAEPHSVTSQAAPDAFTPGSVASVSFDTGVFPRGNRSFTLPPDVAEGTVIPYYCSSHGSTMATPNGTITIDPSATMSPPPESGGGGGGY